MDSPMDGQDWGINHIGQEEIIVIWGKGRVKNREKGRVRKPRGSRGTISQLS